MLVGFKTWNAFLLTMTSPSSNTLVASRDCLRLNLDSTRPVLAKKNFSIPSYRSLSLYLHGGGGLIVGVDLLLYRDNCLVGKRLILEHCRTKCQNPSNKQDFKPQSRLAISTYKRLALPAFAPGSQGKRRTGRRTQRQSSRSRWQETSSQWRSRQVG
jgi:hypothetical protein